MKIMDIIECEVMSNEEATELEMLQEIYGLTQTRFKVLESCGFKVTMQD